VSLRESIKAWVHGCRLHCSKIQYCQVSTSSTFSALDSYKLLGFLLSEMLKLTYGNVEITTFLGEVACIKRKGMEEGQEREGEGEENERRKGGELCKGELASWLQGG